MMAKSHVILTETEEGALKYECSVAPGVLPGRMSGDVITKYSQLLNNFGYSAEHRSKQVFFTGCVLAGSDHISANRALENFMKKPVNWLERRPYLFGNTLGIFIPVVYSGHFFGFFYDIEKNIVMICDYLDDARIAKQFIRTHETVICGFLSQIGTMLNERQMGYVRPSWTTKTISFKQTGGVECGGLLMMTMRGLVVHKKRYIREWDQYKSSLIAAQVYSRVILTDFLSDGENLLQQPVNLSWGLVRLFHQRNTGEITREEFEKQSQLIV